MGASLLALAKSIYYITIEDGVINSRVYIFGFFIPKQGVRVSKPQRPPVALLFKCLHRLTSFKKLR